MSSQVDIANLALTMLGEPPIVSLADNINSARTLNAVYETVRDSEITASLWKFSLKRTSLPALSSKPVSGPYNQWFQLPADFLIEYEVGDSYPGQDLQDYRTYDPGFDYTIEQDRILSNLPAPLSLRYQAQIIDTTLYDSTFVTSFAAKLAEVCCQRITQSVAKQPILRAARKEALLAALRSNAMANPSRFNADDSWMLSRIQ